MLVNANLKQPITVLITYALLINFITNSECFMVVCLFKHTSKFANVPDDFHYSLHPSSAQ